MQAQDNLVLDLIKQSVGIDIFIMTLVGILDGAEVTQLRNAAGDHVLLVMATTSSAGRYMSNITARFGASGLLLPEQVRVNSIDLSSEVQAHNATWDRVLEYEQNMTIAMGQIKGHIAADLSGSSGSGPNCISVEWGEDGTACGCRVAQCGAGDLTADAIAWYTKADIGVSNAGGIRSDLSSGAVTRGDLLAVLPFLNQVLRARYPADTHPETLAGQPVTLNTTELLQVTLFEAIPGSVVREMLVHSVSQVHFRHSGRFLQVSQSVKFEWFLSFEGTATVGAIYVHGELLDEEATYSLAAPNYILRAEGTVTACWAPIPMSTWVSHTLKRPEPTSNTSLPKRPTQSRYYRAAYCSVPIGSSRQHPWCGLSWVRCASRAVSPKTQPRTATTSAASSPR